MCTRMAHLVRYPRVTLANNSNIYILGVQTAIAGQGCCGSGIEQFVSFSNTTAFPTAGLVR